ncbi:MAG: hypothetical protein JW902_09905 [Syntrophaceae bacterium]|nr:hypothetical protein [Syntrophaceae bacterium]
MEKTIQYMRHIILILSWIAFVTIGFFALNAKPLSAEAKEACFHILADDDLVCVEEICPGTLDIGGGVFLQLAPGQKEMMLAGPPVTWMNIGILDKNRLVRQLPDSFYIGYAQIAHAGASYLMIGEYTGGMHCCSRYHFFARPAPDQDLIYVGTTASTGEGIESNPFSCHDGALYLEDWDTRFQYFHTPYARSLLEFPTHYKITLNGLSIDNRPFHVKYLRLAEEMETDIDEIVALRTAVPASILDGKDEEAFFTDELGQMLVKRTILYLFAKQEEIAWDKLRRDMGKYYQQQGEFEQLQQEIRQYLAKGQY